MKTAEFCYWLQGFFELSPDKKKGLSADQTEMIRRHLALVFIHDIDPKQGGDELQEALQKIHDGPKTNAAGQTLYRC